MCRLEQLCVQYLEAAINQRNVLVALENASSLQLNYIKEFCLRYCHQLHQGVLSQVLPSTTSRSSVSGTAINYIREFCLRYCHQLHQGVLSQVLPSTTSGSSVSGTAINYMKEFCLKYWVRVLVGGRGSSDRLTACRPLLVPCLA